MNDNARSVSAVRILLIEDNPGDAFLIREAMNENKIRNSLHHVSDGDEALAYLARPTPSTPRPDLILLDLNLPKKDGREVLTYLKANPELCSIPVVVLTSSSAEEDIARSYQLHANCYVTKPLSLEAFVDVVKSIESFWVSIVRLPLS